MGHARAHVAKFVLQAHSSYISSLPRTKRLQSVTFSALSTKMHLLALVWLVACCMLQHVQAETVLLVNVTSIQHSGEWVQVLPTTLQA